MKKLAVFDIDGTLFHWQLYHELVFELKEQGYFSDSETHGLDDALLSWQAKNIPWNDYETTVIEVTEHNLTHIPPLALETAACTVVERSGHKIYGYTAKLLRDLQAQGYFTLAISGSQQEIAEQFALRHRFDDCVAAVYERENDAYTGRKSRVTYGRKDEIIREYVADNPDLTLDGLVAVGDSGGDIAMLRIAEHPIAFNPAEDLLDEAIRRGWQIVVERKNIAYTLEAADGHIVLEKTNRF